MEEVVFNFAGVGENFRFKYVLIDPGIWIYDFSELFKNRADGLGVYEFDGLIRYGIILYWLMML